MSPVWRSPQSRSHFSGLGRTAVVIGSLVAAFVLILTIVIFVWLRPKRNAAKSMKAGRIEHGSENGLWNRQNLPETVSPGRPRATGEGEEVGSPPTYQVEELMDDAPPAYESAAVWPGRLIRPVRPNSKWTGVWPFRSTSSV